MAKNVNTMPGKAYTVTSAVDCTVSTPSGVVIATHAPGAQTLFIAPTAEVVVSDDAAFVTEAFKGAALAVQGGGGLTEADVEKLLTLECNDITLSTPTGTENASCNIVELDPERVPVGVLTELTYRTGASTETGMTTEPIWCAVYELAEGSTTEYILVGLSSNTVTQAINLTLAWKFDKLPIHGRRLRLVPTIDRENIEAAILRVRTTSSTDTTCCINSGTSYAFTPQLSITALQARMRFAPAAHVDDSSMHVSEAEREAWNAAARGELTPEQMSVLGALMPETLGGVKVVSKDADGSENGRLRVIVTPYAENIVGANPMTIQAPSITHATAHQAASYTDPSTGTSYAFWGHTTDSSEMAAYGITEPCVWVGDPALPLKLRGTVAHIAGLLVEPSGVYDVVLSAPENGSVIFAETPYVNSSPVATKDDIPDIPKFPVGTIIASLADHIEEWVRCDGTAIAPGEYPELYDLLISLTGQPCVPDLRGRTLQGVELINAGSYIEAGLPDIQGQITAYGYAAAGTGAFSATTVSDSILTYGSGENTNSNHYNFKASRSNSIYGNSDTVQPPAFGVNYFIYAGARSS